MEQWEGVAESGCILKVEPTALAAGLAVGMRESEQSRTTPKVLALATARVK